MNKFLIFIILVFLNISVFAQGDGPRSHLPAPVGVWGVVAKSLLLDQNLTPSGNILVSDADVNAVLYPTTFFHTFGIKGHFFQVLAMINPGSVNGQITSNVALPKNKISASGFSDGFVGLKFGLINTSAIAVSDFGTYTPSFNMSGYFRFWYSGTYDSDKLLNLGTNRNTIELGLPMSVPFGSNPERLTWLEVFPNAQFYTDNNDPVRSTSALKTEQKPLLILENHLTHNFGSKLWAGLNLRYQYGGETISDGVDDDNRQNFVGGGAVVGYKILPFLSAYGTYGGILWGDKDARSQMFRISVSFTYAKLD